MAVETQGISGFACPELLVVSPPTDLQQRASFHGKISVQKAA